MTPNNTSVLPTIIQGGMGVYVSSPALVNAVAKYNDVLGRFVALATVSGTAADRIMVRILQRGDPGGHYRRALSHFPFPEIAKKVLDAFYVEEGNTSINKGRNAPVYTIKSSQMLKSLIVCANFAFVWLSKEGHDYPISINYLEKIAMPHIFAITGAMLAGVNFITMGAGIPRHIPEVINSLLEGRTLKYPIPVKGENITELTTSFNPEEFFGSKLPAMQRPGFIPIISSNILGMVLAKKLPQGSVDYFVVETDTAGGHNALPRDRLVDENNEPIYNERDLVNYQKLAELGIPFWIGGSYASPEGLARAKSQKAVGIQAGSIFALSNQSGLDPEWKRVMRRDGYNGRLSVQTSLTASPTGYALKVADIDGTVSKEDIYEDRERVCSQGALRELYEKPNTKPDSKPEDNVGYRCSAEPVDDYVKKGGNLKDTEDVRCVCNGLVSGAGLGNLGEPSIITIGNDVSFLPRIMEHEDDSYDIDRAFKYLLRRTQQI